MTDVVLRGRTYRLLDTASKLFGLSLLVLGLEAGPATAAGATLVAAGIAIGTITAVIETNE